MESRNEALAYLIGALADGSLYRNEKQYIHRVSYYQKSKEYLDHCIEPRVMFLFNKKGHYYHDTRKDVYFYEITIKSIYQAIDEACTPFKDKVDPRIPTWIKEGSENVGIAFIKGFFDAEGCYMINPRTSDYRVRFGQANHGVLQDLRDMLGTRFTCSEVLGPYQTKPEALPYYELQMHGIKQVQQFHDLIKPCHPDKQRIGNKDKLGVK